MNPVEEKMGRFQSGGLALEVYPNSRSMGVAAARGAAETMRQLASKHKQFSVIFATGASQLETLDALTQIEGLPWGRVCGFHLDEYVDLPIEHPASFRAYLRRNLTQKVRMKEFYEIDGTAPDPNQTSCIYAEKLSSADPQLCLLGIGENGHLAFMDPDVADFNDPRKVKVVRLDNACREQQVGEGWFETLEEVPESAISLTIPIMFRVPKLIVSVPGGRKAKIVRRALEEPISTNCPATILRRHPDVTVYLDQDSAAELEGIIEMR